MCPGWDTYIMVKHWLHNYFCLKSIAFKGPFCNIDKISLYFQSDSVVAFVSYAHFTVLYCCIGHYVGNFYVDINKTRLFHKAMNLQEMTLHTNIMYRSNSFCWYKNLNFFEEVKWKKWGCRSRNGLLT